jgi:predicted ester cyclase
MFVYINCVTQKYCYMSINIIKSYFDAWNKKDLEMLSKLIDIDIKLKDWEQEANGQVEFINANTKLFEAIPCINAQVLGIACIDEKVFARLSIKVTERSINVIDYFELKNDKITMIQAYRCF